MTPQMLLMVLAAVLFILAGVNVRSARFEPEWFAFACVAAAMVIQK